MKKVRFYTLALAAVAFAACSSPAADEAATEKAPAVEEGAPEAEEAHDHADHADMEEATDSTAAEATEESAEEVESAEESAE